MHCRTRSEMLGKGCANRKNKNAGAGSGVFNFSNQS